MATKTMRALKVLSPSTVSVQTTPIPPLRPGYLLARVHSIALNPTDWKHIDLVPCNGTTAGVDLSGTITTPSSPQSKLQAGDKIIAFVHGCHVPHPEDGAFGDYALVKESMALRMPEGMSFSDGATIALGAYTVGQALFQTLGLPMPGTKPCGEWVLIYGGSTATGTLAIRLAKLAGAKVVSANSPKNDGLVKEKGADATFDYSVEDVGKKIREFTGDKMRYAFDCVSKEKSSEICGAALTSGPGAKLTRLDKRVHAGRDDVEEGYTFAYTTFGDTFKEGGTEWPATKADEEFADRYAVVLNELLSQGKIKPHPTDVREGGLDAVAQGLDDLRHGRVSGKKIVYNLQ